MSYRDELPAGRSILIVAGEPSGDRHGAGLARAIREIIPEGRLWGMGGDEMARDGVALPVHMDAVSVVGITEVLGHLAAVFRARRILLREVDRHPPAVGILIDFPDFNLWLARALRRRGVPLLYYIAPQVWAWRRGRMRLMARLLDRVAVILPFEEDLLRTAGVAAEYVGHPLIEQVKSQGSPAAARMALGLGPNDSILGILPGSRPREVERLLPVMLKGAKLIQEEIPEIKAVVALSPLIDKDLAERAIQDSGVHALSAAGQAQTVIRASRTVLVASGTVTLEAALLETPMVVAYRTSWFSYLLGRLLVRVKYIALVNILAGGGIVPELIQNDMTPAKIRDHVVGLWHDEGRRIGMVESFRRVKESLGDRRASQRTARMILEMVEEGSGLVA